MSQDTSLCLTTTDDALPGVLALLPTGYAWDAAQIPGTIHNKFWRAIAGTVAYVNSRFCAYIDELYCSTASESLDQWREEYAFDPDDNCNPYPNLCSKISASGGQTCDYYVEMAAQIGWVITCSDLTSKQDTLPIAGCMLAGKTQLGPPMSLATDCFVSCAYGPASAYPDPHLLAATADRSNADCPVPGSILGQANCCMMAGEFSFSTDQDSTDAASVCGTQSKFTYPKPVQSTSPGSHICLTDATGYFQAYTGYAHQWEIVIDIEASTNLQKTLPQFDPSRFAQAGCVQAGCFQTSPWIYNAALCFLESVKPAHTTINYKLINT